ncbi:hypothetical protein BGW80DRAFT_1349880 [Lactifluus volemus]|nr:hypothetical protein BGW80DRAFT_1349880 [Lactifluus volemus]
MLSRNGHNVESEISIPTFISLVLIWHLKNCQHFRSDVLVTLHPPSTFRPKACQPRYLLLHLFSDTLTRGQSGADRAGES